MYVQTCGVSSSPSSYAFWTFYSFSLVSDRQRVRAAFLTSPDKRKTLTRLSARRAFRGRLGLRPLLLLVVLLFLRLRSLFKEEKQLVMIRFHGAENFKTVFKILTDRERERFLWCFLDFFECFFVLEWWCWHSC